MIMESTQTREEDSRFVDFLIQHMRVLVKDVSRVDSDDIKKCYSAFLAEMRGETLTAASSRNPTSYAINAIIKRVVDVRCQSLDIDPNFVIRSTTWRVGAGTKRGKAYSLGLLSSTPSARLGRHKQILKVVGNEDAKRQWENKFASHAAKDTDAFLAFCEDKFKAALSVTRVRLQ
tara:strand:+ start:130 stop:654 length:525 start_codon:yes stop_codon:yes gene_type:complete